MSVSVQHEPIAPGEVIASMHAGRRDIGAIATFLGLVRDLISGDLQSMTLEHYPGMTEKALQEIEAEARRRWPLQEVSIVHRFGELKPAEHIVMVAVASAHRADAFQACEFIMDYLKTRAPFWKKETTSSGGQWVDARHSDDEAERRWS